MSFHDLGLRAELLRAVSEQGYDEPTPVQSQAIPVVLAGHDLMAGAQTGTGKTAAFTLPILHLLSGTPRREPARRESPRRESRGRNPRRGARTAPRPVRALVLTPTRELAAQISESVKTYGRHLPLSSSVVFGGVSAVPQIKALRRGVDILVATPGRLLDHIGQENVDLSQLEILVLDEADRMLDMGFIRDIRRILGVLPRDRQNLLFSATFPDEILTLAGEFLHEPERIQIARRNAPPELVAQMVHPVDRHRKRELLAHLIGTGDWRQVLVFTRTKRGANRLAEQLDRDGISASAIHGNKSQGARTKALGDFKRGSVRVLVATDIAARGLDIDQLPHVVNYELPHVAQDYVHRIGRTGRAGREGAAVSLVCVDEHGLLGDIERLLRRDLPRTVLAGYEPDPSIRAEPLIAKRSSGGGGRSGNGARPGVRRDGSRPQRGAASDARRGSGSASGKPPRKRTAAGTGGTTRTAGGSRRGKRTGTGSAEVAARAAAPARESWGRAPRNRRTSR